MVFVQQDTRGIAIYDASSTLNTNICFVAPHMGTGIQEAVEENVSARFQARKKEFGNKERAPRSCKVSFPVAAMVNYHMISCRCCLFWLLLCA
jgi:hypothetical protein